MEHTETGQQQHDRLRKEIAAARARLEGHEVDNIRMGDLMTALSHELDEIVHRHGHDYVARKAAQDQVELRLKQVRRLDPDAS